MSPIRAENRRRYPSDWRAISDAIRFDRANARCECLGECGRDHDSNELDPRCGAIHHVGHPVTGSIVVLTVAHLDHTPENCDPDNLRVMCQRCHLSYDRHHHAANAARTRLQRATAGMEPLL